MLKTLRQFTLLLTIMVFTNFGFAEIIKKTDLYGVWVSSVTNEEADLLNLTALRPSNDGLDILIVRDGKDSIKIRQNFTWDFNEETQTFSQLANKVTYFSNGKVEAVEEPMESSTATIKILKLGEEVIGITFINPGNDDQTFLKIDPENLKVLLEKADENFE